jgi:hypothetical protein
MNVIEAKDAINRYMYMADTNVNIDDVHQTFVLEKMKLDKQFSLFLDEFEEEMNQSDQFDSSSWKQYKIMLKEYNDIERCVAQSRYYLNKNV